jgi:hypothetical protein
MNNKTQKWHCGGLEKNIQFKVESIMAIHGLCLNRVILLGTKNQFRMQFFNNTFNLFNRHQKLFQDGLVRQLHGDVQNVLRPKHLKLAKTKTKKL